MVDPAKPRSYLLARMEIARLIGATPVAIAINPHDHDRLRAECLAAGMLPPAYGPGDGGLGLPVTVIPWWGLPDVVLDNGRVLETWLMEGWVSDVGRAVRDVLHRGVPDWPDERDGFHSEHAPPTPEDWSGPRDRTLLGLWEKYVSIGGACDETTLRRLRELGA